MTQTAAATARKTLTARLGTSPKTLHRKAMEQAAAAPAPEGESLEQLFPVPAADVAGPPTPHDAVPPAGDGSSSGAEGTSANADQPAAPPAVDIIESSAPPALADEPSATPASTRIEDQPALAAPVLAAVRPSWSSEDERVFQVMSARRKAAGFQRRGRDVSAQRVKVGAIAPNAGTVVATIVGIVGEKGVVARAELIDLMAGATFANAKAKQTDRDWCVGYIAGAVRDGFLALADDGIALGEASPDAPTVTA